MEYSYDNPEMKAMIHELIADEMKSFTPSTNYLAHLPPYPQLKFANSPALAEEFARLKKTFPSSSSSLSLEAARMNALDMKRYELKTNTKNHPSFLPPTSRHTNALVVLPYGAAGTPG